MWAFSIMPSVRFWPSRMTFFEAPDFFACFAAWSISVVRSSWLTWEYHTSIVPIAAKPAIDSR